PGQPRRQRAVDGRSEQVARRVVEGLDRQRDRAVPAGRGGDAAAQLDQAVETAAVAPRTLPAVGVMRRDDQRGVQRGHAVSSQPSGASASARSPVTRTPAPATRRSRAARPAGALRSAAAVRSPAVVSGSSAPTSAKPGGSKRSTSAPYAARNRVPIGPAMT